MNRLRKISIATFVVIIIVTINTAILVSVGAFAYKFYANEKITDLQTLNHILVVQSSKSLALPLWNFDRIQLSRIAESIMLEKAVYGIVVRQTNPEKIILSLSRDSVWGLVKSNKVIPSEGLQTEEIAIQYSNENIGTVQVILTSTFAESRLKNIRTVIILLIGLTATFLTIALYYLFWKFVLKPLRLLEQFGLDVSKEENDVSTHLKNPFIGELENLRTSITTMINLIKFRQEKLLQETKNARESENLFRLLTQTIPDLVWLKNPEGIYLFCNPAFELFFGAKETDIKGKSDYDFVEPDLADLFRKYDLKVMESNHPSINEEWVTFASDNHRALLETVKVAMHGVNGNLIGILGISRDITEKKKIEEELEQHKDQLELIVNERTSQLATANEELTLTNEALTIEREKLQSTLDDLHEIQKQLIHSEKLASLGVLSAGVAHELNNPLNFIQGGLLGIEEYLNANPKDHMGEVEMYTSAIKEGIRRAAEIVSSLNHYNRSNDLTLEVCDIHGIIDNCLIMMQSKLRGKVEISKNYTGKNCHVLGNEGKLHQVMLNIIANAEQAITGTGTIDIVTETIRDHINITISDSGLGISQEHLQKIFDPFFTTKEVGKGTGMGLSITHNIIQEHNGTISYKSIPGHGTTVTIKLPTNIPAKNE